MKKLLPAGQHPEEELMENASKKWDDF